MSRSNQKKKKEERNLPPICFFDQWPRPLELCFLVQTCFFDLTQKKVSSIQQNLKVCGGFPCPRFDKVIFKPNKRSEEGCVASFLLFDPFFDHHRICASSKQLKKKSCSFSFAFLFSFFVLSLHPQLKRKPWVFSPFFSLFLFSSPLFFSS